METGVPTSAELLAIASLIAATIQYFWLVRRRAANRLAAAVRAEAAESGLRGLTRMLLMDDATRSARLRP